MARLRMGEASSSERDSVGDEYRYSFQEHFRAGTAGGSCTLNLALRLEHDSQETEALEFPLAEGAPSSFSSRDELEVPSQEEEGHVQVEKPFLGSRMQWLDSRFGELDPPGVPFWETNFLKPSKVRILGLLSKSGATSFHSVRSSLTALGQPTTRT